MIARRSLVGAALAGIAAGTSAGSAVAQDKYPSKPLRLVIPFPPGGGADAVARPLGPLLTETLGQPVVLDNRGGANGNLGAEIVAKAPADGYTLLLANSSLTISGGLYARLPFDPRADFSPISLVGATPSVLATNPSLPVRTVKEFVELAKARPGKLSYGSSGVGSTMHLGAAMLQSMAGLDMVHVPYKGGGPAIADALSGQTDFIFVNPVAVLAQVKAGKLNALAVTSKKRLAILPDVPTFAEAGYPGLLSSTFYGVLGPAGLPREVVLRLNAAVVAAVARKELADHLVALGYEMESNTPEQFAAFLRDDAAQWLKLIKLTGASAE
ncbi:MAG TPA: tripartite tricarboxylate transporter substrate binding protein [Reyranella sp.]|nr:tripartite tricarboxylate transporter substrate binding protein [Reyranella sp.]